MSRISFLASSLRSGSPALKSRLGGALKFGNVHATSMLATRRKMAGQSAASKMGMPGVILSSRAGLTMETARTDIWQPYLRSERSVGLHARGAVHGSRLHSTRSRDDLDPDDIIGAQMLNDALVDGRIIKLNGLPYKATCKEIEQLLAPHAVKIGGIVICEFADGMAVGMAYAEMEQRSGAGEACRLDGKEMAGRFLRVQRVQTTDRGRFAAVLRNSFFRRVLPAGENQYFVKIWGMPFSTTPEEVYEIFAGHAILRKSLRFLKNIRETVPVNNGMAQIAFSSMDDAYKACDELDGVSFKSRYIELIPWTMPGQEVWNTRPRKVREQKAALQKDTSQ